MTQDLQHKIENIINCNQQADDKEILFQLKQLLYKTELQNSADKEAKSIADLAEIILAKNRNGPSDDVRLRFREEIPQFTDLDDFDFDDSSSVSQNFQSVTAGKFKFSSNRIAELEEPPW